MANYQELFSKDYSLLLELNFDSLDNRFPFDAKQLLDKNLDWCLIGYRQEMELIGSSNEQPWSQNTGRKGTACNTAV